MLLVWEWLAATDMKLASLSTLSCKAKATLSVLFRFFQWLTWSVVPKLFEPVQRNHVVLHMVLALALAIALGAMLLLLLVMVLGIALLGDFLAALGIASTCTSALDDTLGHHCSTCPMKLEVNVIYTKQWHTGEHP